MAFLPVYPRSFTEGDKVFIEHTKGNLEFWGHEASVDEALRVAAEIDLGLKLISFVRQEVDEVLNAIRVSLGSVAPEDLVEEVLIEDLWRRVKRSSYKRYY